MKYLVILIILIVAGYYVYDYFLARTPERLQRTLTGKWFSPARNPMPEFKQMVERFEVGSDFTVTVYLTPQYATVADGPAIFQRNVKNFISLENPRSSAPVRFIFKGEEVSMQ